MARFAGYAVPQIAIAKVEQEGAAGSSYCTVTGTLTDGAVSTTPARSGKMVLRRVNDAPGATREQLRWTIRSSTFAGDLQAKGNTGPA